MFNENRNFLSELNSFIKSIDNPKNEETTDLSIYRQDLYNIHKRSLPVGIDKIVEIGLTKEEALTALSCRFKTKLKNEIMIYYDMIAQKANDDQMNIYFNEAIIIK